MSKRHLGAEPQECGTLDIGDGQSLYSTMRRYRSRLNYHRRLPRPST